MDPAAPGAWRGAGNRRARARCVRRGQTRQLATATWGSGGWWRRRAAGGPSPVGRDAHAGAPGFASWRKRTVERGYWIGQLTGTFQSNYQPTGALLWPEPGISSWPVRQGSFKSEGRSPRILGRGRLRVREGMPPTRAAGRFASWRGPMLRGGCSGWCRQSRRDSPVGGWGDAPVGGGQGLPGTRRRCSTRPS
jgi:hypothetical protein